jgi:histidyl-tRNA synthetase
MKQADRSGARYALILEDSGSPVLRDMRSGEQREVEPGRLAEEIAADE